MTDIRAPEAFWSVPEAELLRGLATSARGLARIEAIRRASLQAGIGSRRKSSWSLLLDQFRSPIILLLLASAALIFGLGGYDAWSAGEAFSPWDAPDGLIILFILVASGLLGFWQERSANDAVARLLGLIQTTSTVLREGQQVEVPLADVVVGDVIVLRAGDVIPADCRLLDAQELSLNEAALTGESFPAEKFAGVLPIDTPLAKRANLVFLGTHVVSGYGNAVAAATGQDTELGRITGRLEDKPPETGFERGIRQFGHLLIRVVIAITVVVFCVKVGFQDKPFMDSLLVGLALAVGMTPQLLPAVTSVVLAAGAIAMSRRQVIVKQLLAIENLGSMTVLCADKTGTLTEGTIRLHVAENAGGDADEDVLDLAWVNAVVQSGFVNPIDRALRDAGDRPDRLPSVKLAEIPYDFSRKRLSVLVQSDPGSLMIMKGALNQVLACCTHVRVGGQDVPIDAQRAAIDRLFLGWSDQGYRVLGLATRCIDGNALDRADESGMTFRGLLVFADPPKADASQTIGDLRDLGVTLKIITGDNHAVAESISRRVGLDSARIVRGSELRQLDEAQLLATVNAASLFVEVEPNQKEQIVLALKRSGQTVGYLGDGINDAPALHAADVGISVAEAVDVARDAAQVVLLKQDLAVLVEGVREGRRTFANTLKYVFFAIAANFGYMFSLAVAGLVLPFEPLLAPQILLVNLLADFPAMALATDRVDPEQIQRPRRWDTRFILRFMMSFGLTSSCFDFMMFGAMYVIFAGLASGGDPTLFVQLFQTGWFIQSTLTGLVIMAVIRTRRTLLRSQPGALFLTAVLTIAVVTIIVPFSPLGPLMGFVPPPLELLAVVLTITVFYGLGMEVVKHLFYRRLGDGT